MHILQFSPGNHQKNLEMLLRSEGLNGLEEVSSRIREFSVRADRDDRETSSGVDPSEDDLRELALLVLYLYHLSGSVRKTFRMVRYLRNEVISYYGQYLCQQAVDIPRKRENDDLLAYQRLGNLIILGKLLASGATIRVTTSN